MDKTRILIVEDEFIVAQDVKNRLIRAGYEVAGIVAQGDEALQQLETSSADIVLMDIALRGALDGIETATYIRSRFDIPVIYLTAHADPETLERAGATGPFGYVLKPFDGKELLAIIEMALYKHRMDKQVRERGRWLSTVLASIGDAVVVADAQRHIAFLNPMAEQLVGCTSDEIVGRPITDSLHISQDHIRFSLDALLNRVLRENTRLEMPQGVTLTGSDGVPIPIRGQAAPIQEESSVTTGVVLTFHSISTQVKAEAERDEQRRMLRALLDNTPDIVIFKDRDSRFRAASERFHQLVAPHIPMSDFLGQTDFDIFPADDAQRYREEELQVMETGKPLKAEHLLHTLEGRRWFEAVKMPLRDEAGNMIGVFTSERNITDRLQAESERDEQRRMLRAVLDTLPDFILFKDTDSVFRVCNKAFCDFIGLSEDELIGKTDFDVFPIEEARRYRQEELEVMQTGNTVVNIHPLQRASGVHWEEAIKTPLRDEQGEIIGVLIAGRDITARVQAEEDLARRAQEMTALYETSLEINAQQDVSTLLQDIVRRAAELVGTDMGALYLMTPDRQQLKLMVDHNLPMDNTDIKLQLGEGLAGRVAQLGKPLSVEDYSNWQHRAAVFDNVGFRRILSVPLKVGSRIIGTLNVADADRGGPFEESHVRLVSLFADQAAIAMENARLLSEHLAYEREIEQRNRELTVLYETLRAAGSSLNPNEVFRRVAQTLAEVGGYRFVSTYMREEGKLQACEGIGYLDEYPKSIDASVGVLGRTLRTGEPQFVVDGSRDPDFVATSHHLTSEICVPIKLGGEVVGVLNIETNVPEAPLTENDLTLMMALADQLKLVVSNARLYQDLDAQRKQVEQFNEQLLALQQVSVAVTSHLGLPKLLDFIALSAATLLGGDSASIFLFAEDKSLTVHGSYGLRPATVYSTRHKLGQSITGIVAQTGKPLIVDDVSADSRFENAYALEEQFLSMISTPLTLGKNIIGVLNVHNSQRKHAFDTSHLHILSLLAHQAAVAIETADLYQSTAESESRYRELFERNLDGLVLVSAEDGQIIDANSAFQEMLGYSLNDLKQRKIWEIRPSEHQETARRYWAQYQTEHTERGRSIPYQTRNGRIIETEFSTWSMETNGRRTYVTSVRDVTDKLKLEDHLRQAQKMEAVGTLAGGIAHDFNNILGSILGYASFVKDSLPADDPARADVEVIERSARRGAELTHQLLAFAQGGRYEIKPIDLNVQVEEVVQLLSRTLDKTIAVRSILDCQTAPIVGNAGQINQLLLNLCINAAEAMPAGGFLTIETKTLYLDAEAVQRELGINEPGDYTLLTVSDTGHGMESDILERIFEPFFSTKKGQIGKKHGGLGLAMVFGIVKGHNGIIQVESQVGEGTTFKIWLLASEQPVIEEQRITLSESVRGVETVLVVDDEESLRSMLNRILSKAGYQVLLAATGMEAVEILKDREKQVDLVILDMIMPEMNGLATFRRLKELIPNVQVLLSSGYSDQGQAQEALGEGALGFIQKPFSFQDILGKVRTTLDGR